MLTVLAQEVAQTIQSVKPVRKCTEGDQRNDSDMENESL